MQAYVHYLTSAHTPGGPPRILYLLDFHFHTHPYRAWNFTVHIGKQQAIIQMSRLLVPNPAQRTLLGWGDRGQAGAGVVRARRGPEGRLLRALHPLCTVVSVDEFRTSMMCAECGEKLTGLPVRKLVKGVWRLVPEYSVRLCTKGCHACVHRDINAARNMLQCLLAAVRGELRPRALCREGDIVWHELSEIDVDRYNSDAD